MGKLDRRNDKARAVVKADERRRTVLRVYQGCEESGARTLARLATRGVVPTCSDGCAHCCSLEVPISRAEGETIVAWLAENATPEAHAEIRERLRAWLAWYREAYPGLVAAGIDRVEAFFRHAPPCALLENGRCRAYAVRPVTCRNHLVSSPVDLCDPAVGNGEPALMLDVARASFDHVAELRAVIEQQGGNYLGSIHLIGEWLAHLLEVEREPWVGSPTLQLR